MKLNHHNFHEIYSETLAHTYCPCWFNIQTYRFALYVLSLVAPFFLYVLGFYTPHIFSQWTTSSQQWV